MRSFIARCLVAAVLAGCSAAPIDVRDGATDGPFDGSAVLDREGGRPTDALGAEGSADATAFDAGGDVSDAAALDAPTARDALAAADAPVPPQPPLTVTRLEWNATGADLGAVQAVAEDGDIVAVYTDHGLRVMVAGAIAARDDSVRGWRAAITAAAADGSTGSWILGVDASSRVHRLRDRAALEDVTSRLALGMRDIRSAARVADGAVAFGGSSGFAVLRGSAVTAWSDPDFVDVAGGGNRIAAVTPSGVKVFDLGTERAVRFGVTGVTGFGLSRVGALVVTVGNVLYEQNARGELAPVYAHPSPLRAVTVSGANTWLVADGRLALWDGFRVRTTAAVAAAPGARLIPATGGGVWLLQGGALSRYALVVDPEEARWNTEVRSIFATRCTPCHLPGGTAGIDLSTRCAWAVRRDQIRDQVVARMLMPPAPMTIAPRERDAIAAYLNSLAPDACGGVPDAGPPMDVPRDTGADVRPMDVPRDTGADVRPMDVPRDAGSADARPMDVPRDAGSADARSDVPRDAGPVEAGTPAFSQVQGIFNASCTGCHGGSGGLNLGSTVSYANLVNVPAAGGSCGSSGTLRVVPGDPSASLLYRKVAATQPCGSSMPRGGPALPPANVEIIRRWIAGGAPR